ncbi:17352_t:CDS:2, partial [Rhizophagus irregularis]
MTKVKRKSLSKIIISHLSNETKNNLKNQEINIFKNSYQKPLFDYISFCRHLNLGEIKEIIYIIYSLNEVYEKSKILIIMNEILKLFFNENRKFTHLYIPKNFDYQIYHIPGARRHLSEIEFLSCNTSMNDNILIGLIDICKSIKELELSIDVDNYGIIKLIKTREKLISLSLLESYYINKSPFDKIIENSLATHTNTLQNFKINRRPTKIPSFINLKVLELEDRYFGEWNCLENLSLPFLQILRTSFISIKPLTNLIKNTNRSLIEIKIDGVIHDEIGNKNIIQAIYKNCPKLKYLKLMFRNCNILELENLLTNCQHLKMTILNRDVLYLIIEELRNDKNTLISCLSVDKTFCEIIVPILWKNPWKILKLEKKYKKLLLNVIISHFSDETKNYLSQSDSLIYLYKKKPLFNYISFCKHLNFEIIRFMINSFKERSKTTLILNEMLKLFNNEDLKFSHLYIPKFFDYQINFTENCCSGIKYFSCSTDIKDNILFELVENCKSIEELEIRFGGHKYNNGIGRLIEAQKNLFSFSLIDHNYHRDLSFDEIIENALIKHSNNIYYYKITTSPTKVLSSFVNLKILEFDDNRELDFLWNYSLPHLQILRVKSFSEKGLADLIKSTCGSLIEIKIDYCDYYDCTDIIQAIYQNCPKLKYLKLRIGDWDIFEFEKILINCRCPILLSFDMTTAEHMEDLLKEYEDKGIIENYSNLCDDDDGFELGK